MKKFTIVLNEQLDINTYSELIEEVKKIIIDSIGSDDTGVYNEFIEAYQKDPENNNIKGLINESDIYDFYLKWRSDIDEILSETNFYDNIPSKNNVFGLYDYVIYGTKSSILEIIKLLK